MKSLTVNNQIRLEQIKYNHAFQIFQAIDQNRGFLSAWLPFVDQTRTQEDTESFIRSVLAEPADVREDVFVIWYQDHFAGLIGFKDTDLPNMKTEIGYWLTERMTGKGIMKCTVEALVSYTFMNMNMNRIQIKVAVGNDKSAAIPKKLGFYFEGVERAGEKHKYRFLDLEIYSLLKSEWTGV
ncbi:MAG: GNAT family protein [Prolixibacteraceae bacterium]